MESVAAKADLVSLDALSDALRAAGYKRIAGVREDGDVYDLAFVGPNHHFVVARLVDRPRYKDYRALKTMLEQGPFERAVLVYCGEPPSDVSSDIETWSITDLPALAASFALEGAAP